MSSLLRMRDARLLQDTALSHMSNQPGARRTSTAGKSGWTKTRNGGNDDVMMGTRHSTVAAQQQGGTKALAWTAEVTWSDASGAGGPHHPSGKRPSPGGGDGEWCMGNLGGASDVGMGGGNVVLSW